MPLSFHRVLPSQKASQLTVIKEMSAKHTAKPIKANILTVYKGKGVGVVIKKKNQKEKEKTKEKLNRHNFSRSNSQAQNQKEQLFVKYLLEEEENWWVLVRSSR